MAKHFFYTALFVWILGVNYAVQAQTEKGNILVNASVATLNGGFDAKGNNIFNISLNPKIGYFFNNDWVAGLGLTHAFQSSSASNDTRFGLSPFARYYFTINSNPSPRMRIFAEATLAYQLGWYRAKLLNDFDVNYSLFSGDIGPGAAFFLTHNVALEALLKVKYQVNNYNSASNIYPDLSLGFQFFIPKRKAERVFQEEMKNFQGN